MKLLKGFISYAHDDEQYFNLIKEGLRKHGSQSAIIDSDLWQDEKILLGYPWHETIQEQIIGCDFAVFLVSASFLSSKYIIKHEFKNFLERQENEGFLFFPLLIEPCDFEKWESLAVRQFFKPNGRDFGCPELNRHFTFGDLVKYNPVTGDIFPNTHRAQYFKEVIKKIDDALSEKLINNLEEQKIEEQNDIKAEEQKGMLVLSPFHDEMIHVEGGDYSMGSENRDTEKPIHTVAIKDFYLCKYPITNGHWNQIMGVITNNQDDDNMPKGNVSWDDAQEFIKILNKQTGEHYRLPSEAEWEFAARGGIKSQGFQFAGSHDWREVAWLFENSDGKPHPVGQKRANELGLHDVSGNVWEWCEDDWHDNYFGAPLTNSAWVDISGDNNYKVLRGGGCFSNPLKKGKGYTTFRQPHIRDKRLQDLGFRLAKDFSPVVPSI